MAKFKDVAPPPPQRSILDDIGKLVRKIRELQAERAQLAADLEACEADITKLVVVDIPEAMRAAALTELKLTDGAVLRVKSDVNAYINEANAPEAYAWLRAHGHGAVIKKNVIVDVRGLPGPEAEGELAALLESHDIEYSTKESIHAATLKSLVKGLLEEGITPPPAISIHQYSKAELKEPKR